MSCCGKPTTTICGKVVTNRKNCINNDRPGQPEYQKGWKPEENTGCCPPCHTVNPCGTQPTNPKGLLPGQAIYVRTTPITVGTCSGPAYCRTNPTGGVPADGGPILGYGGTSGPPIGYGTNGGTVVSVAPNGPTIDYGATSGGVVSKVISACTSRFNTRQCIKSINGDGTNYQTVCTETNRQSWPPVAPTPPSPPFPATGVPVAAYGQVTLVASAVETTIVSYTSPTGYAFHCQGFSANGDTDAYFRLYVNGVPMISARSSISTLTATENFATAVQANEGETVSIRVTHWHSGLQVNFDGTILGYLT